MNEFNKTNFENRAVPEPRLRRAEEVFNAEAKPSLEPVQNPTGISKLPEALQLQAIREEIAEIKQAPPPEEPTILELPEPRGGVTSILAEKSLKKRVLRQKEQSPKGYKEKLLVISDLQLLRETNEQGVGALLKYMEDQAPTFTHIVLNGDIMDFTQQSGFRKDNQLGDSVTQDEQVAGRWFIDFVNKHFAHCKRVYNWGNHEQRYANMYLDTTNGVKQYLRPFEEVFGLQGWEMHQYGNGDSYNWHGRLIRHGTKSGAVMNIPKIEMDRSWKPTTVGHAITNRMWEQVDGEGESVRSYVHAGFSKVAAYDKSGDKKPSNGFGVYYYSEVKGKPITTEYQVIFGASNPQFISPEGKFYSGVGFNLRQEIGLDPKRGRPRTRG